jgi:hypothetical protein
METSTPRRTGIFLFVLSLTLVLTATRAAEVEWINSASGNWSVASNWSTQTVPGPDDHVIIDRDGTYTITLNSNATVAGLELGSAISGQQVLLINSSTRTLTVNGPFVVRDKGLLRLTAGTITGTGDLTIASVFEWQGGTLSGSGVAQVDSGGTLSISGSVGKSVNGRTLRNSGLIQLGGTGTVTLSGNALLENEATGRFDAIADANVASSGTPRSTWNNLGQFRRVSGNGTVNVSTAFNNQGEVEVLSGLLQFSGTGNAAGRFSVAANTTLRFSADYTLAPAGVIEGAGRAEFTGGSATLNGTYNITGSTLVSSGSLTASGTVVNVGNSLSVSGGTANFGTNPLEIGDLSLTAGTLANSAPVNISERFSWSGGTLGGSGPVNILPDASMGITGTTSRTLQSRTVNLEGTATWTGITTLTMSGAATFNIRPGGVFDLRGDSTLSTSGSPRSMLNIDTQGTLIRSTSIGAFTINSDCNNEGVMEITSGTLRILGGGTGSGQFMGNPGTTLRFGSLAYSFTSASRIVSGGNVDFNGGTLAVPGIYAVSGATLVTGATVSFTGPDPVLGDTLSVTSGSANLADASIQIDNVTLSGGTISGTGVLTVRERLSWTTGTFGGIGTTRIAPDATMAVSGTTTRTLSARTLSVAGSATVAGTAPTAMNTQASIEIEPGGIFELQGDANISTSGSPASTFINRGTVIRNTGSGTFSLSVPVTQSGLIESRTGTLRFASSFVQTAGTLRLAGGALTTTSFLDLQGGVLTGSGTINGIVRNAGQIHPGSSPGSIQILGTGGWTNAPSGTIVLELAGINPSSEHDQLISAARANLSGIIEIKLADGYTPNLGDSFEILRFGSVSGAPTAYRGVSLSPTLYLTPQLSANSLVLVTTEPPGPVFGKPQMLSGGGGLRLTITEAVGLIVTIEASEDLLNWTPIYTNANSPVLLEFIDTDVANYPYRFYRSRIE